ncbi:MAG: ferritin-like domain-containing protein, partial [Candidatus Methylomirabilaceae bacterium]
MVADQIKAEAAAIQHYNNIAKMTFGKDPVTYSLITELLADEVGHEEFLENLLGRRGSRGRGHHSRSARRGGSRAAKKR